MLRQTLTLSLLALTTIGLYADQSLVNVAGPSYGTKVVADSAFAAEYGGEKAVDGSLEQGSGCWYSRDKTDLPTAITFELAGPTDLRRVVLHQAFWHGNMYHTREFALETSSDGKDWQRIATGELADESLARAEVNMPEGKTRWLRVVVLTSYNSYQTCGLAEVELLAAGVMGVEDVRLELQGRPATASASYCGLSIATLADGPQVMLTQGPPMVQAVLEPEETVAARLALVNVNEPLRIAARAAIEEGQALVVVSAGRERREFQGHGGDDRAFELAILPTSGRIEVSLEMRGMSRGAWVVLRDLRLILPAREVPLRIALPDPPLNLPPTPLPELRPSMEQALIEADWRMQDGVGTLRNPVSTLQAVETCLQRGGDLLRDLRAAGVSLRDETSRWRALEREFAALSAAEPDEATALDLWRRVHLLKRQIALKNPLADVGPLAFVKQVPGAFSHQLTQCYGRYARPGGGVFVLDEPGRSMKVRDLTGSQLPVGSVQNLDVSYTGDHLLFAFCEADTSPENTILGQAGRYYHLYAMNADGSGLRRLTDGPYDDFAPRHLPDGRIVFVSTRRGGWHRCGYPGCENYTLTVADADGSDPMPISLHETQEWDPAVLHDGRIAYTRWDYVDRNAVFFEQLWTTAPDGTRPAIFYGNQTFNPVGVWEPRAIPGSPRVMATAAAHHAMTAGSIVLVDVAAGVDGHAPLTRLTPEVPFPEGEFKVEPHWYSAKAEPLTTPENLRWPGHCFRSPFPLSEKYFLAAYSFERLIGEPKGNAPNMFGLYLADAFGNRELLYRDLTIASLWPTPLRPRERPPVVPEVFDAVRDDAWATVLLQNVQSGDPPLSDRVRSLRIIQVLPKSTPGIDRPPVGVPSGAPGKQVLGTVPVEEDGSAWFRVPARTPVCFQALDERGQAIQVMRSLIYMQPGETISCAGCHEPRTSTPAVRRMAALKKEPSTIKPGPDGSKPFSYPILVQPVLDRACVGCHSGEKPGGGVRLTGEPDGHYTVSYNALARRVPYSDQGSLQAVSQPNQYGARGSGLMRMLWEGHHGVELTGAELERLITWMDTNVLFYGTFKPEDQALQQKGERIAGPDLE